MDNTADKSSVEKKERPALRSLFSAIGSETTSLSDGDIKSHLLSFLDALGPREDVLILPPDYTRFHSQAGQITRFVSEYYNFVRAGAPIEESESKSGGGGEGTASTDVAPTSEPIPKKAKSEDRKSQSSPSIQILPALGTHAPMTEGQIRSMFGEELATKQPTPFMVHDWRNDVVTIGHAPAEMVSAATSGMVDQPWPAQLNKHVWDKRDHDPQKQPHKSLVLSIGQVVPHEVMGMANFNKNLFVGVGGVEAINLSHFIGAVHGMERMMGRASNPLRSILNYASEKYLQEELDLWYILTVMGTNEETGDVEMRGLFIGNDIECYNRACELSLKVNFTLLDEPLHKVVVNLDEDEFHSTWLGNKAIYRTRMAIADGGELIILGPGVKRFGEDDRVDELIRKYGYVGTPAIMKHMQDNEELKENLSAVAHLIHGSSEGRFKVTYCPGHLTREEVESAGFGYGELENMKKRYDIKSLRDGWNVLDDDSSKERFYFVSNPALGLWAVRSRFEGGSEDEGVASANSKGESTTSSAPHTQVPSGNSAGVGGWAKPPNP